jgi:hypothetical protein
MKKQKTNYDIFLNQMWKTKGARFNACRRLKQTYKISNLAISLFSSFVILISLIALLPSSFGLNLNVTNISLLSLLMSMFILLLSLLENGKQYEIKSERLFNNANEITRIYDKFRFILEVKREKSGAKIESLISEYHFALDKCQENHEPVDYEMFEMEHPEVYRLTWIKKIEIRLSYLKQVYGLYISLMLVFGLVLFCLK